MTHPLRDQLIGTWTMQDWYNETASGERIYPLGEGATGYISYTHDNHVLVQLSAAHREPYAVNDPFGGTMAEDQAAIRSQISYSGTFSVEGDTVVHNVVHASCPNWIGSEQRRLCNLIDKNTLTLSAAGAMFQGQTVTAYVHWTRAVPLNA